MRSLQQVMKDDGCFIDEAQKIQEDERASRTPESSDSISKDLQLCLEFLHDLRGEWEWKHNSISKNNGEMEELDGLIKRIEQRLKQNV